MQALTFNRFGTPDVLELREVPVPRVGAGEVLVRVEAVSLNRADLFALAGFPAPVLSHLMLRLRRKNFKIAGSDIAGIVHTVGPGVTEFEPGDVVLGEISEGALAQYAAVPVGLLVRGSLVTDMQQAAALPMAGVTALQALRDAADIRHNQSILINGASGGVGSHAVQLARYYGAEVTGVCSTEKIELVKKLGADHVIDYTKTNFRDLGTAYDIVLDLAATTPVSRTLPVLKPDGTYVLVGGPVRRIMRHLLLQPYYRIIGKKIRVVTATPSKRDLEFLSSLVDTGHLHSAVNHAYPMADSCQAYDLLASGQAQGKVVITLS